MPHLRACYLCSAAAKKWRSRPGDAMAVCEPCAVAQDLPPAPGDFGPRKDDETPTLTGEDGRRTPVTDPLWRMAHGADLDLLAQEKFGISRNSGESDSQFRAYLEHLAQDWAEAFEGDGWTTAYVTPV